jgi:hypothetical protein
LERLELRSKIGNFFRPISRNSCKVDVAFVLTEGSPTFTNSALKRDQPVVNKGPFYAMLSKAVEDLRKESYVSLISPSAEKSVFYDRLVDIKLHPQCFTNVYEAKAGRGYSLDTVKM